MRIDKLELLKKGWTVQEIEHATGVIARAEDKKHIGIKFLDKSIYWALLFLLILANIIGAIFFLPFIFTINHVFVTAIVGFVGYMFGTIFSILIRDIRKTEHKTYKNLKWALVISGLINFFLIVAFIRDFGDRTGLVQSHNPMIIGTIFLITYLMPEGVSLYLEHQDNKSD